MLDILKYIKKVDTKVFKNGYAIHYKKYKSWKYFTKRYKGNTYIHLLPSGYCLYTGRGIESLASIGSVNIKDLIILKNILKDFYGARDIIANCRGSTSFRLITVMAKRGEVEYRIVEKSVVDNGEVLYNLDFRFV